MADNVTTAPVGERRPLSFIAAAGWTVGLQLLLMIAVQLTDAARPGARADLVSLTACYALSYSLVLFAMLRLYEPTTPVRSVLAVRGCSIPGAILAAISGAGIYPALSAVDELIAKRHPTPAEDLELLDRMMQTNTAAQRIVIVVSLGIIIPLCHELFFRGILYGGLRRGRAASLAIFGTTVFFATSNLDLRALPTMLALGLLLSLLRSRSGSIVPAALAHVAYWLVPLVPVLFKHDDVTFPRSWVIGGAAIGVLAALGASAIFSRDERALVARIAEG